MEDDIPWKLLDTPSCTQTVYSVQHNDGIMNHCHRPLENR